MGWAKLDDSYPHHPKVWSLSDGAFRLHTSAICDVAKYATDGIITRDRIPTLIPRYRSAYLTELVDKGVWHRATDVCERCRERLESIYRVITATDVVIHDYLDFNPTAEQEKRRREASRKRVESFRSRKKQGNEPAGNGVSNGVTAEGSDEAGNALRNGGVTRPRPVPSRPVPSPDLNLGSDLRAESSSSVADEDDDRAINDTLEQTWAILAQRHLEQRNDDLEERGRPAITATFRRARWRDEDARRTSDAYGVLARTYLAADPTLTALELADLIDSPVADAIANSRIGNGAQ